MEDFELEKLRNEIQQEKQMKEMLEQSAAELRATVEELEKRYDTIDNEGNEWKTRFEAQQEMNEQLERQILMLQNKVQEAKTNLKDEDLELTEIEMKQEYGDDYYNENYPELAPERLKAKSKTKVTIVTTVHRSVPSDDASENKKPSAPQNETSSPSVIRGILKNKGIQVDPSRRPDSYGSIVSETAVVERQVELETYVQNIARMPESGEGSKIGNVGFQDQNEGKKEVPHLRSQEKQSGCDELDGAKKPGLDVQNTWKESRSRSRAYSKERIAEIDAQHEAKSSKTGVQNKPNSSGSNVPSRMKTSGSNVPSTMKTSGSNVQSTMKTSGSNVSSTMKTSGSNVPSTMKTSGSNVPSTMKTSGSNVPSTMKTSGSNVSSTMKTSGSNIPNTMKTDLTMDKLDINTDSVIIITDKTARRFIRVPTENMGYSSEGGKDKVTFFTGQKSAFGRTIRNAGTEIQATTKPNRSKPQSENKIQERPKTSSHLTVPARSSASGTTFVKATSFKERSTNNKVDTKTLAMQRVSFEKTLDRKFENEDRLIVSRPGIATQLSTSERPKQALKQTTTSKYMATKERPEERKRNKAQSSMKENATDVVDTPDEVSQEHVHTSKPVAAKQQPNRKKNSTSRAEFTEDRHQEVAPSISEKSEHVAQPQTVSDSETVIPKSKFPRTIKVRTKPGSYLRAKAYVNERDMASRGRKVIQSAASSHVSSVPAGSDMSKVTGITIDIAISPRGAGKTPRDLKNFDDLSDPTPHHIRLLEKKKEMLGNQLKDYVSRIDHESQANPHMIRMLEKEKNVLHNQLRDLEWRLDQESKPSLRVVQNLEKRKNMLQNQLRDIEWRLDQESKAYHKANDERKSYALEINTTKGMINETTTKQKLSGSREQLETIPGSRTPRTMGSRVSLNEDSTPSPSDSPRRSKPKQIRNTNYRSLRNLEEEIRNIPEDRRILDPKLGPIQKTAAVKNLPSLEST